MKSSEKLLLAACFCLTILVGICSTVAMMPNKQLNHDREMAEKMSDIIRCSMDNGDTIVVKIMRDINPDVEQELPKYIYCY